MDVFHDRSNSQSSDYDWFIDNYDKIVDEFGTGYIVIKNKTVLGRYTSYAEGVRTTMLHEPIGTFIVQKCSGNPSDDVEYINTTSCDDH